MFKVPEKHKVMRGRLASTRADGNNGDDVDQLHRMVMTIVDSALAERLAHV